jgi:hypothetical protein
VKSFGKEVEGELKIDERPQSQIAYAVLVTLEERLWLPNRSKVDRTARTMTSRKDTRSKANANFQLKNRE